jgi:hypothetical protein
MRVDLPLLQQSVVEPSKIVEKKEIRKETTGASQTDESLSFAAPLGSGGTYSLSSLRAAVDYHAKFLTVAENNVEAANHTGVIPRMILDRLNGR